jgi:hypothetical protein
LWIQTKVWSRWPEHRSPQHRYPVRYIVKCATLMKPRVLRTDRKSGYLQQTSTICVPSEVQRVGLYQVFARSRVQTPTPTLPVRLLQSPSSNTAAFAKLATTTSANTAITYWLVILSFEHCKPLCTAWVSRLNEFMKIYWSAKLDERVKFWSGNFSKTDQEFWDGVLGIKGLTEIFTKWNVRIRTRQNWFPK